MAKVLKMKAAAKETTQLVITAPNYKAATFKMVGTAPYIQNRFSSENRDKMMEQQKAGSGSKRTRKAKPAKDFQKVYEGSLHVSKEGWFGIPASGLRAAMIEACRLTEFDMVRAKMCIRIIQDGVDRENLEPLVRIKGEPRMFIDRVKIGVNSTDLAARGMFENWSANVQIEWDADVFSAQDVLNLLTRAGWQVGIGAGRPLSKMSAGTGKGTWKVEV